MAPEKRDRKAIFNQIQDTRKSKLIVYFAGDRPGFETKIADDAVPLFYDHLDKFQRPRQIDLFLYTRGGIIHTPPRLIELIREFTSRVCVLVPYRCHSAGTLFAIGADEIVMTKLGELSPVDPQIGGPEESKPGEPPKRKQPFSVENFASYISFAKEKVGITEQDQLGTALQELTKKVSPVDLGGFYRAYSLIRLIVRKLLSSHMKNIQDDGQIQEIIDTLTERFFSHEYLISRAEAKRLGLKVNNPKDDFEKLLLNLYREYHSYLKLDQPKNPPAELGGDREKRVTISRAIIESENMCHEFVSKVRIYKGMIPPEQLKQLMSHAPPEIAKQIRPETVVEEVLFQGWELKS